MQGIILLGWKSKEWHDCSDSTHPFCSCRVHGTLSLILVHKGNSFIMKCTQVLNILLIDDNALTSLLVLRFFAYLGHKVRIADKPQLPKELENDFDLILINLACSFHEHWIAQCIRCLDRKALVISYAPDYLIHDFNQAERRNIRKPINNGWIRHSKLFQFINTYKPLSMV